MIDVDRPVIPDARYLERTVRAQELAAEGGIGAVLVGFGADLRAESGDVV